MTTTKHKSEDITVARYVARNGSKLHAYPSSLRVSACGIKGYPLAPLTAAPTCQRCRDWWDANVEGGLLG